MRITSAKAKLNVVWFAVLGAGPQLFTLISCSLRLEVFLLKVNIMTREMSHLQRHSISTVMLLTTSQTPTQTTKPPKPRPAPLKRSPPTSPKSKGVVLHQLHAEDFPFAKLTYVLKRHLYTPAQSGKADAEEGVLLASSEPSYVEAYENYVRKHPNCPEALKRAAEALRRVEEKIYL